MIPGSDASRISAALERGARGNPWSRRLAFGLVTAVIWVRFASVSDVERWRFPAVMLLAVLMFEIAIVFLKRFERDHGVTDDAVRRRGTLVATGVLAGVVALAAVVCAQPWYGVLGVLFAYVGFLFSRYVPDALFGAPQEQM